MQCLDEVAWPFTRAGVLHVYASTVWVWADSIGGVSTWKPSPEDPNLYVPACSETPQKALKTAMKASLNNFRPSAWRVKEPDRDPLFDPRRPRCTADIQNACVGEGSVFVVQPDDDFSAHELLACSEEGRVYIPLRHLPQWPGEGQYGRT